MHTPDDRSVRQSTKFGHTLIIQTWRSVAKILSANVIIPGHGAPIPVTRALLEHLCATFPMAEHAPECLDVLDALTQRLEQMEARGAG